MGFRRIALVRTLVFLVMCGALLATRAWSQERSFYYKKIVTLNTPGTTQVPDFAYPTTITLSPDGRLFFAQQNGKIFYVTLDSNFNVVGSVGEITTIFNLGLATGGRLVTGMTFGPNGNLFVSHSDGRIGDSNIDTSSGTVTELYAPTFTGYAHIVTNLPRSKEDHASNGLAFGPDGKLYLAQGGMTNAGLKSASFLNVDEVPASGAILQIDINSGNTIVYATGFRNPYDLLWHSNGQLYANDNGPNLNFGFAPVGHGDCVNPGTNPDQADKLNLVVQGHYYGHPNPSRSECDFNGGDAPIHWYTSSLQNGHTSSDGMAEYTSSVLPGLLGRIITANWNTGNIVGIHVAGTGADVNERSVWQQGLHHPLDVEVRQSDGAIFIAEHGLIPGSTDASQSAISVLRAQSNPAVDFDGDRISDLAVYRPSNANWYIRYSSGGTKQVGFGLSQDLPRPADFDGDGKTDLILFRPSTGCWYVALATNSFSYDNVCIQFGLNGDIPVTGDFDGDGLADLTVFRPSNGYWYIRNSSTLATTPVGFGGTGDVPLPADFDGDGKTDLLLWRPLTGCWYVALAANNFTYDNVCIQLGLTGDIPVVGDFDGDGLADLAVFRPSNGNWYIRYTATGGTRQVPFGGTGDVPKALDVDGDGKSDLLLWRPSTGAWYVAFAANNFSYDNVPIQWGLPGDIPLGRSFTP